MSIQSLPFELDRDEIRGSGVPARGVKGTVHVRAADILIEFQLEVTDTGEPPHTVGLSLRDVREVSMTGGAVKSPRLLIETSDDAVLSGIPWAAGSQCVLRFRRADGQRLRELIEEIEIRLAEERTREADG